MKKEKNEDSFIKKPYYNGGSKALNEFIQSNLVYPETAIKMGLEGTVIIRSEIDHKGNVVDAKVLKGIGQGCDEEASRIVKMIKFEVPKNPRKLKILFHKDIQIRFKINKQKPDENVEVGQASNVQLVYNIVSMQSKNANDEKSKQLTYNYTIKY